MPNTGGLLPCYFKADWERAYKRYKPHWEPPKYGICADDWPTAEEVMGRPSRHSRLRVFVGGTDLKEV